MRLLVLMLSVSALLGADKDFNGRWNLDVKTPRGRTWWLEVEGAGTGTLKGRFVGAPGGQVDVIPEARIENGELIFHFERQPQPGGAKLRQTYRARLQGDSLSGLRQVPGEPDLPFRGTRAAVINEKDDGKWREGKQVVLFNGKDTTGWSLLAANGRPGWRAGNGLLVNEKGAADLVSDEKFWNFVLRAEYRYGKGSNSGIALRGRYEIQICDDFGKPPDSHGQGALYSLIAPKVNAGKAPGEWQTLEIRLVGRDLTVALNGTTVISKAVVEGPTAMVMDPSEGSPGPIVLQGDHGLIEFRKVEVTPLSRR